MIFFATTWMGTGFGNDFFGNLGVGVCDTVWWMLFARRGTAGIVTGLFCSDG